MTSIMGIELSEDEVMEAEEMGLQEYLEEENYQAGKLTDRDVDNNLENENEKSD